MESQLEWAIRVSAYVLPMVDRESVTEGVCAAGAGGPTTLVVAAVNARDIKPRACNRKCIFKHVGVTSQQRCEKRRKVKLYQNNILNLTCNGHTIKSTAICRYTSKYKTSRPTQENQNNVESLETIVRHDNRGARAAWI